MKLTTKPKSRKRPAKPAPIITQRLSLLAEATARLAKAERLAARWRREADRFTYKLEAWTVGSANRAKLKTTAITLRWCADDLERILKP